MSQPRLCLFSQTPPVRFLRDGTPAGRTLSTFREGADYLASPGGVTRMLNALLRNLSRRRQITGADWLALANHGPTHVELAPDVRFHPVRLAPAARERYANAKGTLWNAVHALPQAPPDPAVVDDGLALLSQALGARAAALHRDAPADLYYVHDFQLLPLARHLPSRVPRVFRWHIPLTALDAPLMRLVASYLDAYDAVIVSTEGYAERLRDAGVRVPVHAAYPYTGEMRQRVVTAEDVDAFERRWNLAPDDALFLLVARLDPMKNQDDAIRAFAQTAKDAPHARLMLVGGGGFSGGRQGLGMPHAARWRDRLLALAKDLGVADRVTLTGTVPEADLEVAYTRARAVLLPSRIEGFGLAAVEGWLYGHPVLVSRGAGVSELVRDGENGYAFDAGDVETLAARMRHLALDPDAAAAMGREGRETARECEARHASRRVWSILEDALARGPTVGARRAS
jgi:glycosyltransferase involved in cell wall biosynthesis